jgi:hypothetical protein
MKKKYAEIYWTIEDIKTLQPKWPDKKCVQFLERIEEELADAMDMTGQFEIKYHMNHETPMLKIKDTGFEMAMKNFIRMEKK